MSADAARRALALLDLALEVPPEARDAWLATHTAGDAALAAELRALLAAAARSAGVLEAAPLGEEDLLGPVRAALAGRYTVEHELGRGGMARVFRAREHKHDRPVVLKVLDPTVARALGSERFLREVRLAATLAHPHVVPLLDSGAADGLLYYVMPYLAGETLRARLRRGPVPWREATALLRDIGDALRLAHARGVVHRDLKPENVLVTGGHAYLLDFGIAKLVDAQGDDVLRTDPGRAMGTRRYMAPEQLVAPDSVDGRADVYAWGALGVELLLGDAPRPGEAARVARALSEPNRRAPPPLVVLLVACLDQRPEGRPADMDAVLARLGAVGSSVRRATRRRAITIGAGTGLVAALLDVVVRDRSARPVPAAGSLAQPVAVGALRAQAGDSALVVLGRYAGDWITEGLQQLGSVRVVPWSIALGASERAAAEGTPLVRTLREGAGAATVVSGTLSRVGDSLHLQVELSDAASGRVLAAPPRVVVPLARPEAGIAELRDRVMGAVAAATDERLRATPDVARRPPSFPAYRAFDRATERFLAQAYADALPLYREAYARDTAFVVALLQAARAAWNTGAFATADTLVRRARARDTEFGTYHEAMLGHLEALLTGDGRTARLAIARAAAIEPQSRAGYDHAAALLEGGDAAGALARLEGIDPDRGELRGWSSYWTQRAHALHVLGRHRGELEAARQLAARHPDRRVAQVLEARALAAAGDEAAVDSALAAWDALPADVYWSQGAAMVVAGEEALRRGRGAQGRARLESAVRWLANRLAVRPDERGHRYWLASALYDLGRDAEARGYAEALAREAPDRLDGRTLAALVAARLGDERAAARWLGRPAPRERGAHLAAQARVAAARGESEAAVTLLTEAAEAGAPGLSWLGGSAVRDFTLIARDARVVRLLGAP